MVSKENKGTEKESWAGHVARESLIPKTSAHYNRLF